MNPDGKADDLGVTILKGACNAEARDVAVEVSEIAMHHLLEEGILKELPFLKTIVACHKTWESIRDQLFLKKVASFICACPRFSEAEKNRFADEHLSDKKRARRLGDAIVLILEKLDDLEKPEMLGKIFAGLVRGKIGLETFRRLQRL